jgi:predicted nucleic-acid-binding Zn-ribbon protein
MKCSHGKYEEHQFRASKGGLGSFFGVESAQYKAIVCARCKFAEIYQGSVPVGQQALNFVFGG